MPDILNRLEALCETANCFKLNTVGVEAKAAIAEITQLRAQVEAQRAEIDQLITQNARLYPRIIKYEVKINDLTLQRDEAFEAGRTSRGAEARKSVGNTRS